MNTQKKRGAFNVSCSRDSSETPAATRVFTETKTRIWTRQAIKRERRTKKKQANKQLVKKSPAVVYSGVRKRKEKARGKQRSAFDKGYVLLCMCLCVCVVLLMAVRKRLETQQALNLKREADKTVLLSYTSQLQSSLCEENTNRISHAALEKKKKENNLQSIKEGWFCTRDEGTVVVFPWLAWCAYSKQTRVDAWPKLTLSASKTLKKKGK